MLVKLLKYDLKRWFNWFWILSLVTFASAGLTRLINLGEGTVATIFAGFFNGLTIGLIVNVVLQPFIRIFVHFQKDCYADESYLTHTLPVTKNDILFSKLLSALIQIVVALVVLVISFFILYWTPNLGTILLSATDFVIKNMSPDATISAGGTLTILAILLLVEILVIVATGFTSVIYSNEKVKNKKTLLAILMTLGLVYAQNILTGLVALGLAVVCGADISAEFMPSAALLAFILTYIIMNIVYIVMHVLISKWRFNKGVNID